MKRNIITLLLVLVLLPTRAALAQCPSSESGSCTIVVSGGQTTVCVGEEVDLYKNCGSNSFSSFAWNNGNGQLGLGDEFTTVYTTPGTYCVTLTATCDDVGWCGTPRVRKSYIEIIVQDIPATPAISAVPSDICDSGNTTLTVTNSQPWFTYEWKIGTTVIGNGTSINRTVNETTSFTVTVGRTVCSVSGSKTVSVYKTVVSPAELSRAYHKTVIEATGTSTTNHYWQDAANGTDQSRPAAEDVIVTSNDTYYIRQFSSAANCWTAATAPYAVTVDVVPPQPAIALVQRYGYTDVHLVNDDITHILEHADYFFVSGPSGTEQADKYYVGYGVDGAGTFYLRGRDKLTGTWGAAASFTVQQLGENGLNWVHTKQFDGTFADPGKTILNVAGESKAYFDDTGKPLQAQTKSFEKQAVFTSESLTDKYDRTVGSTLTAPIAGQEFRYHEKFMASAGTGKRYDHKDFDDAATLYNPVAVDARKPGTLGWYYSEYNTLEPLTPVTSFPYSRTEYYTDGTGEAKRSASPGNEHRLGKHHDVLSGTFPVFAELNDYLAKRIIAIPGITHDGSLLNEGVQTVSRDENGRYGIAIADKAGKAVMSARKGGASDPNALLVNTAITANGYSINAPGGHGNTAINGHPSTAPDAYRPMVYFYLLDEQVVTFTNATGAAPVIEDIVNPNTTYAYSPSVTLPAGFYRVRIHEGAVTVNYKNYYTDVSYQFYDDAGKLIVSLSPNGFNQLRTNGNTMFNTQAPGYPADPTPVVDLTWYKYNNQGWLLTSKEADAGTARFLYRKGGKIRFSQNEEQALRDDYSYTHYDALGRPVESGEYTAGATGVFGTLNSQLEFENQVAYASGTKDWVKTHYDFPATSIDNLPSTFAQEYLRGAVSWTENENIKTWYSYDELGRVVWMAQRPLDASRTFVTQYTYDFAGSVLQVKNSSYVSGAELQPFYHHYEYDKDKRLSKAYTSIDGNAKKLRATYEYYLHGPLKRIELGDNIQGIDFVYNIHGWLTQINHPDKTLDPGQDDNDVFGMILDYYEVTVPQVVSTGSAQDPSNTLMAGHAPLIRFQADAEELMQVPGFKVYSAESPRYKTMMRSQTIKP